MNSRLPEGNSSIRTENRCRRIQGKEVQRLWEKGLDYGWASEYRSQGRSKRYRDPALGHTLLSLCKRHQPLRSKHKNREQSPRGYKAGNRLWQRVAFLSIVRMSASPGGYP